MRLPRARWLLLATASVALLVVASCGPIAYYAHSIRGGLDVLARRRPIQAVLDDPRAPEELKAQLRQVLEIRQLAVTELGLPDNGSYRTYADLGRPYVVWNVVAAPELSVEPVVWCFPVAGCVSYRGYFSEERAERFAERLRRERRDVDVAGVAAYSTLGWFRDPVLNTFVWRPPSALAGLLIHEMAHQRLYLPGDTELNESFATVVEIVGVERWLETTGREDEIPGYLLGRERQDQVAELVLATRGSLAELYASEKPEDVKRREKADRFAALRAGYEELKADWGGWDGWDDWFEGELNNADLAAFGAYHRLVPALQDLLADLDGDLDAFYAEVEALAPLDPDERRRRLGVEP